MLPGGQGGIPHWLPPIGHGYANGIFLVDPQRASGMIKPFRERFSRRDFPGKLRKKTGPALTLPEGKSMPPRTYVFGGGPSLKKQKHRPRIPPHLAIRRARVTGFRSIVDAILQDRRLQIGDSFGGISCFSCLRRKCPIIPREYVFFYLSGGYILCVGPSG